MTKSVAATALAVMVGIAAAASAETVTTDQTTTQGVAGTQTSRSVESHAVDSDGTVVNKSQSVQSGNGAITSSSRVEVKSPDGTVHTVERQTDRALPPPPPTTTTTRTTTTTSEDR